MQHELVVAGAPIPSSRTTSSRSWSGSRTAQARRSAALTRAARRRPTTGSPSSTRSRDAQAGRDRRRAGRGSTRRAHGRRRRACPPTCSRSTSGSATQKGGVGAAAPARSGAAAAAASSSTTADLGRDREGAARRGAALRGVRPDPGPHRRVRALMSRATAPSLIEADGGSRGNPGPAAYGAVLLGRRHRRGDRRGGPSASARRPTTSRSTAA